VFTDYLQIKKLKKYLKFFLNGALMNTGYSVASPVVALRVMSGCICFLFRGDFQPVSPSEMLDGTVRQSFPLVSVVMYFVVRYVVFFIPCSRKCSSTWLCIYFLLVVDTVRYVTLYCFVHLIVITVRALGSLYGIA